jgi:hypothetical protein
MLRALLRNSLQEFEELSKSVVAQYRPRNQELNSVIRLKEERWN